MDVSWIATALCSLIQSALPQFSTGMNTDHHHHHHSASSSKSAFLPTASLLQPLPSSSSCSSSSENQDGPVARKFSSFYEISLESSASRLETGPRPLSRGSVSPPLRPVFASRVLQCVEFLFKSPHIWRGGAEDGWLHASSAEDGGVSVHSNRRMTGKGHAAVVRSQGELEEEFFLFCRQNFREGGGRTTMTGLNRLSSPSGGSLGYLRAVLLCLQELLLLTACADPSLADVLLHKVGARLPSLLSPVCPGTFPLPLRSLFQPQRTRPGDSHTERKCLQSSR